MLRGWRFAVSLTLCCTLGWSTAHATPNVIKPAGGAGKSGLLRKAPEPAKGGLLLKNGTLYLGRPVKYEAGIVRVEVSEIAVGKWFTTAASALFGGAFSTAIVARLHQVFCLILSCDDDDKKKS
ncbi:hypothetical protein [Bradyrhizobium sp. Ai1a-2]|uniref:hypothetical protein n=1 Tax=Bradyrhizobium sp. Ai1a-2 TaxID=196490 RepID=UPI001267B1A3|nr:hypothetical protein [Bradyrhizobium sp. Ai1a-2]